MVELDTIIQGDCLEIMRKMEDFSINSVVADPPYNIGFVGYNEYKDSMDIDDYLKWQLEIFKESSRLLKNKGSILWLNYPEVAARIWELVISEVPSLVPQKIITWIYHQHTGGKPLRRGTRLWLWFSKGIDPYIDEDALQGRYRNPGDKRIRKRIELGLSPVDVDWWFYEQVKNVSPEKTFHPCQLPIEMVSRIVKMVTSEGGIVLDCFAGSATTCEAAVVNKCHYIGIEKDQHYVDVAHDRMKGMIPDIFA